MALGTPPDAFYGTRDRIFTLMNHGYFDPYAIAAVLNIDPAIVLHVQTDPTFEPDTPVGP